jgi:predicted MFS family arabinose efflux permease
MSDYFRPAQRNKALAFFYLAIPVGAAVGFTLGGALATAFGWRWAFAICGLPGVLLSLLCLIIDEPERGSSEHDLSNETETAVSTGEPGEFVDGHTQSPSLGGEGMTSVEQVEVDTTASAPEGVEPLEVESQVPQSPDPGHPEPEPPMPWWPALVAMWHDKGFVYSLAGTTLVVFASGGMADWFTSYLQRVQGFSLNDASLYTGAMTVLGGIGGTVCGAWASDKLVATGAFAAAEFLLMSVSIALSSAFAFAALYTPGSSRGLVVLFLFLTQFFLWFYSGPSNSVMSRVPLQVRTRAFAVSILIQHALGDAIASPIVGVISDSTGSLATAVGILPFFLAAGALVWFIGWVRVPDPLWTRLHNNSERHFHSCFGHNEHNE